MKINRTQAVVLGFVLLAWLSLPSILVAAPEVLDGQLRLPAGNRPAEIAFLVALSAFLALLSIGVVRRWRWTFWLVLVAFLAGLAAHVCPRLVLGLPGAVLLATMTAVVIGGLVFINRLGAMVLSWRQ